jgi:hypothetical protein
VESCLTTEDVKGCAEQLGLLVAACVFKGNGADRQHHLCKRSHLPSGSLLEVLSRLRGVVAEVSASEKVMARLAQKGVLAACNSSCELDACRVSRAAGALRLRGQLGWVFWSIEGVALTTHHLLIAI